MPYATITFKSVYERVLRLMEYDPATWTGSAADKEAVAVAIEYRVREAWENSIWSVLREAEERTVTTDSDEAKYVAWTESGKATILHPFQITRANPRKRSGVVVPFAISPRGMEVDPGTPATVWVQYRVAAPRLTQVAYNGATTYATDDIVYDATTGDCYRSLIDANVGQALSDATKWERQLIPLFLSEIIQRGAFADLLRNDGQGDRADVEESRAFAALERAVLLEEQQGQSNRFSVTQ